MCDIDKISRDKEELTSDINKVIASNDATIVKVEENVRKIKERAARNLQRLTLLL